MTGHSDVDGKSSTSPGSPRPSEATKIEMDTLVEPIPSNSNSSNSAKSDRVRKLFESLETFDSLYICPIKKPFPAAVTARLLRKVLQKYELVDYYGVTRFYAAEIRSRGCWRPFLCSNARAFEIVMFDPSGELLFESARECSVYLCMCGVDCPCVGGTETVANFRSGGHFIGSVVSESNCKTPTFIINNKFCDEKFYIRGPKLGLILPCKLCGIRTFPICLPKTDVSVGRIMYGYDGLTEELVSNPSTVGVIFPPRCSPEVKACILTAGFMLDITYFKQRGFTIHRILRYIFNWVFVVGIIYFFYFVTKHMLSF